MRELILEEVHSVSGGGVVDALAKTAYALVTGVGGNYIYDQLKAWLGSQPASDMNTSVSNWMSSDGVSSTGLSCTQMDAMVDSAMSWKREDPKQPETSGQEE
jgi:hypothetical protein